MIAKALGGEDSQAAAVLTLFAVLAGIGAGVFTYFARRSIPDCPSVGGSPKEAIAGKALESIEPGMTVLFDDGTTLLPLVKSLGNIGGLTVINTFVPHNQRAGADGRNPTDRLGGEHRPRYDCFSGLLCT